MSTPATTLSHSHPLDSTPVDNLRYSTTLVVDTIRDSTSLGCKAGSPHAVQKIFLGRRPSNRDPRRTPLFLHQPSFFKQPPCRLPFVTRQASVVELESTHGGPVTGPSAQQSFKCSQSLSSFATPPCLAATLVDTCYIPVDSHPTRLHPCRQPSVLDKPPGRHHAQLDKPRLRSWIAPCCSKHIPGPKAQ